MPHYEFRCRACGDTFEVDRPMRTAGDPAACPHGHEDTVKLLSTVSLGSRAATAPPGPTPPVASGGCCGGACGCAG